MDSKGPQRTALRPFFLTIGNRLMKSLLRRFLSSSDGATAVEYGIIVALLSVVIVGAVTGLGQRLYNTLGLATNAINH